MAQYLIEANTGTETINALEGTLFLPPGATVGEIYTGNSAVLIWISEPKYDKETNIITFAGLTPGGFRGKHPIFLVEGENLGSFSSIEAKGYKNDGSGTEVPVAIILAPGEVVHDIAPPEPFKPVISASPDILEGKHFVSFAAQDKGTGVERYEYASSWVFSPREWQEVRSPQVLSTSELFQKIHIQAIDHAGNVRVVSTAGPYHYPMVLFGVIILACVLLLLRRSFHSRSSSPY